MNVKYYGSLSCSVCTTEKEEMEKRLKRPTSSIYTANSGSVLTRRIPAIEQVCSIMICYRRCYVVRRRRYCDEFVMVYVCMSVCMAACLSGLSPNP